MAVGTIGVLDLSIVTDALKDLLTACIHDSPLFQSNGGTVADYTITPTGDPPDIVKTEDGVFLSLYLFHVVEDRFQKNALTSNPNGGYPRSQAIPLQPLSLDLYYLLTAYASSGYLHEQQAMTIAMRCFHENPIVITTVPFGAAHPEQFSLSLEIQSVEEISRLWQAIASPLRLSALYRVAVVFISPEAPPPPGPIVKELRLLEDSMTVPFATAGGQLLGTRSKVTFRPPDSTIAIPKAESFDLSPATVEPGGALVLFGGGLAGQNVYLVDGGGVETDVSAWLNAAVEGPSATRVGLRLPAAFGVPPGGCPDPGFYALRVGAGTVRSNSIPVGFAASVTGVTNPPLLNSVAGVYTIQGAGFGPTSQVLLGTVGLAQGAPGPGFFQLGAGGTQVDFRAPAGMAAGQYPVRIRVGGVESAPSWWVVVP